MRSDKILVNRWFIKLSVIMRIAGKWDLWWQRFNSPVAKDRKSRQEIRASSYLEFYLIVIYAKRSRDQGKGKSCHLSAISTSRGETEAENVRAYDWFRELIHDNYHRVEL